MLYYCVVCFFIKSTGFHKYVILCISTDIIPHDSTYTLHPYFEKEKIAHMSEI